MNTHPLISILVPVYNVEKYLRKCLDSLVNQTLHNIEIIVVNDGSTDKSLDILNEYASKDKRIKIISKENGGLPSARNVGILNARGKYILFVDSDDYIDLNTCQVLYKTANKNKADIVVFGGVIEPISKEDKWNHIRWNPEPKVYKKMIPPEFFSDASTMPYLVRDFIRKDFLLKNNFLLDETIVVGEDVAFQFKIFMFGKNITMIGNNFYHYFCGNENSITGNLKYKNVFKRLLSHIYLVRKMYEKWLEFGLLPYYSIDFDKWAIECLFWTFQKVSFEQKKEASLLVLKLFEEIHLITYYYSLSNDDRLLIDEVYNWSKIERISSNNKNSIFINLRNETLFLNFVNEVKYFPKDYDYYVCYDSEYQYDICNEFEKYCKGQPNIHCYFKETVDYSDLLKQLCSKYEYVGFLNNMSFKEFSTCSFLSLSDSDIYVLCSDNDANDDCDTIFSKPTFIKTSVLSNVLINYIDNASELYETLLVLYAYSMSNKKESIKMSFRISNEIPPIFRNDLFSVNLNLKNMLSIAETLNLNNPIVYNTLVKIINDEKFSNVVGDNTASMNPEANHIMAENLKMLIALNNLGLKSTNSPFNESLQKFIKQRYYKIADLKLR